MSAWRFCTGSLGSRHPALLLFCALLASGLGYRAILGYELFTAELTPFSFVATKTALVQWLQYMTRDLSLAVSAAALAAAVGALGAGIGRRWPRPSRLVALGVAALLLVAIGAVTAAHHRLVFAMHTGLDVSLVAEGTATFSSADLFEYAELIDFVLLLIPLVCFAALLLLPPAWDRARGRFCAGLVVAILLLHIPYELCPRLELGPTQPATALRRNPVWYLIEDVVRTVRSKPGRYSLRAAELPPFAHTTPRLDDPSLNVTDSSPQTGEPSAPHTRDWNVLIVIMESVGAEYVFDTARGNELPMPFLRRLSDEGLTLRQHYSTGNTSPRSIFSLMSGLYPLPRRNMFCTRTDVVVPALGTYLGAHYDQFLVTPSRVQSYFPLGFLRHSGMSDIVGYDNLPAKRPSWDAGRNELDAVEYFLERQTRAGEPFLAVYYSYAPHYYYYDHGPEYRILDDLGKPLHRYYNNLRLLDVQMQRMFEHLRARGQLERTVILLVGDHGEAFEQHPRNITHSRQSFNENYRVPAVLWQPALFEARVVEQPTSHVDILPTLLDALGIPYAAVNIQGESLLGQLRRRHIFLYGNEGTLSSVSREGIKVQVSRGGRACWGFDLRADPSERTRLPCEGALLPQLDALLRYQMFQPALLSRYNAQQRSLRQAALRSPHSH